MRFGAGRRPLPRAIASAFHPGTAKGRPTPRALPRTRCADPPGPLRSLEHDAVRGRPAASPSRERVASAPPPETAHLQHANNQAKRTRRVCAAGKMAWSRSASPRRAVREERLLTRRGRRDDGRRTIPQARDRTLRSRSNTLRRAAREERLLTRRGRRDDGRRPLSARDHPPPARQQPSEADPEGLRSGKKARSRSRSPRRAAREERLLTRRGRRDDGRRATPQARDLPLARRVHQLRNHGQHLAGLLAACAL